MNVLRIVSPRIKKALSNGVRLILSIAILVLAARGVDLTEVKNDLLKIEPAMFVLAVVILLTQAVIMNFRWILIMQAVEAPLPFLSGLRILLVSLWFNQALPSTVGGDLVRIWMLHRGHVPWGRAVKGVLADRVTALIGLVVLVMGGFPFVWLQISDPRATYAIGALALSGVAGTFVLVTLDRWPQRIRKIWPLLAFASLGVLVRFLLLKFDRRGVLFSTAILIHLLTILTCFVLATGLHSGLSFASALVLVPPVVLLSALPLSISGWGVREGAMVAALATAGVPQAAALAISVLLGLVSLVIGLVGGVVWLVSRERGKFTPEQQLEAERESKAAAQSIAAL